MYHFYVTRNPIESVNCISSKKQIIIIICEAVKCALQYSTVLMRIIWFRIKYKSTFHIHLYIYIFGFEFEIWIQYYNISYPKM